MRSVLADAERFAKGDLPILITGEAGTGKTLLARFVHARSPRRARPFVSGHCGAIPASHLEVELFGHGRGAFPDAGLKRGLIERANGGTLFLDELTELPSVSQVRLLHLLQTGQILRIGERVTIRVDTRIITGITQSEGSRSAAHALRPDLYYRLNIVRIHVPPLRDRIEDIGPMSQLFLKEASGRLPGNGRYFSPEAIASLQAHRWPGNVRELLGVVQRAAVACTEEQIRPKDLYLEEPAPIDPPATVTSGTQRPPPGSSAELNLLLDVLNRTRFNITRAAAELNVSRVTFYRMLARNNLQVRQDWVLKRDENPESE